MLESESEDSTVTKEMNCIAFQNGLLIAFSLKKLLMFIQNLNGEEEELRSISKSKN